MAHCFRPAWGLVLRIVLFLLAGTTACIGLAADADLPRPDPAFQGRTGDTARDSRPDWPVPVKAPANAPNIVLVLLDDVGFGATATFGGAARTPALDTLAAGGISYNRFFTTAMCSPTRAALLSGRNHHRVGFGTVTEVASGYPGYDGFWRREAAALPAVLHHYGYSTAAFGKWHNTPPWEISPSGPFDRWPTGLGFDYFYGFMGGAVTQWEPPLYRNTLPVEAPTRPEQGYHLTTDLVNDAITWLHGLESATPDKPYFLYFAPGAAHEPHHVPAEWIARYKGRFDAGWDVLRAETYERQKRLGVIPADAALTPRPADLPAWDSLGPDEKRLYARQMEVFAAFMEQTDHEIGRLLDAVRHGPRGDNTLILYIVGDNGGSAEAGLSGSGNMRATYLGATLAGYDTVREQLAVIDELGGPLHDNHFAAGWAWATNAPFQWAKQVASHSGGTRNPLVVSWPARITARGEVRSQYGHITDIVPTLYDAIGITAPGRVDGIRQLSLDGSSLLPSFTDAQAPSHHRTQYYEMVGNRALYHDGWIAAAKHASPWKGFTGRSENFAADEWALYHLDEDFSESRDLSARYPGKLQALQKMFDQEARRNHVYPLLNLNMISARGNGIPSLIEGRRQFVFHADTPRLPPAVAPNLMGSHRLEATLQVPDNGAEGVIFAEGAREGGFVLYVKDGRLAYEHNFIGRSRETVYADGTLPGGAVTVSVEYRRDDGKSLWGGGRVRFTINGAAAGEGRFSHVGPSLGPVNVGRERGSPVGAAYLPPFGFTGAIDTVRVDML
ncbi:MAG: arylsulfatase [Proteobacteria bacterium]|nr:arylsulfatase [Pseudomonadota bacterium]HQR04842.1 arylsulfatase [Rhodocyclaceae bacterium]